MSTRANIVITDDDNKLWFYRHSDGYPKVTLPSLNKFLDMVKAGKIRDNVCQAAGWLIILGAEEYKTKSFDSIQGDAFDWKVGAYEPTTKQHGDIQYLYTIDLIKKTITVKEV